MGVIGGGGVNYRVCPLWESKRTNEQNYTKRGDLVYSELGKIEGRQTYTVSLFSKIQFYEFKIPEKTVK